PGEPQLQDGRDGPSYRHRPVVGKVDPRDDPEERALPGAVAAHDAHGLPAGHREADAVEHAELLVGAAPEAVEHVLAEGRAGDGGNAKGLADLVDLEDRDGHRQTYSAARGAYRRFTIRPSARAVRASSESSRWPRRLGVLPSTSTCRENWMTGVGGHR